MEPPTCTVLLRVAPTSAAVATWLLPPDDEAVLLSLPPTATATPPATAPPTRAPAAAAATRTCRAENSAIGPRPAAVGGQGVMHSGSGDLDVSRLGRAVNPPGRRAYLLAAQIVGPHEGGAVEVYPGSVESGLVPVGIGIVRDPVGPHAGDVLQQLGLIRRGGDRVGGLQLVRGLRHVLAAGTGTFVEIPGRLGV